MSRKMLIDGSHPEETRVVIVEGIRVEELDYESENKRQLRGNVYLARVTRVEPSLQAAFVEFGGNRHGFLAFSEIHPDYYQIPLEDRKALIKAQEAESIEDEEEEEAKIEKKEKAKAKFKTKPKFITDDEVDEDDANSEDSDADDNTAQDDTDDGENGSDDRDEAVDASEEEIADEQKKMHGKRKRFNAKRRYKIQEVVKRGQILLIQAVKEERGNKGAAMTTYLSLAGRYCVLMPNTPRGGGISRKISNGADRKRLKTIMSDLSVPQGMGVIVRTAGAKRTKAEINRDYKYLSRLWDTIRDTTMKSIAPALIHEEGNLVKRSIRDLYGKGIDEVLVQSEGAHKTAKDFMKMLMPSHAKNVKLYKDKIPLYLRYQVEKQIEACLEPIAQLNSGGYLVIHPTEALVSVDVNSGRSTKERNVEHTALRTNLEAAEEVARQMRLRDLAGLIVIDFIDMDRYQNNRAVEKRMHELLSHDRARVQMGKISQFGLMEISRQRRRRSLLEGSSASCEHCHGVGRKRSIESSALKAIRAAEEEGIRGRAKRITLTVTSEVAAYLFNEKRELLNQIDTDNDMFTEILTDDSLIRPKYEIERIERTDDNSKDPLEVVHKENHKAENKRKNSKPKPEKTQVKQKSDDEDETKTANKRKRRRGRRGGRGRRKNSQDNAVDNKEEQKAVDTSKKPSGKKPVTKKLEEKKVTSKKEIDSKDEKPKRTRKPTKKTSANKKVEDKGDAKEKTTTKKTTAKKTIAKKSVVKKSATKKAPAKKTTPKPTASKPVKEEKTNAISKQGTSAKKTPAKAAEKLAASDDKPKKKGWWQKRNPFS
ncbi:MAG: Rne/Rng family ribonuclease [Robiginitomaculum sp.]